MKPTTIRLAATIAVLLSLTSCLSTSFDLDLTNDSVTKLTVTYTIDRDIWELGVFDEQNPDRAMPVSERDMREIAGYYDDVSLRSWRLEETDAHVTITSAYEIDDSRNGDGLVGLWGSFGAGQDTVIDIAGGRIVLPLGGGSVSPDIDQRALVESMFVGQNANVLVHLPRTAGNASSGSVGSVTVEDSTVEWTASMADAVLAPQSFGLEITW